MKPLVHGEHSTSPQTSIDQPTPIFAGVSDALYIQDRAGTFVEVNDSAVRLVGYTREELLGKSAGFVAAPGKNDLPEIERRVELAFAGAPQQFEFWGRRANGEIFPAEIRLCLSLQAGEQVVLAMVQDITERKLAEAALRENLARFHRLLRDIPLIAVQGYGPDGTTQYWNTACEHLYGYSAQEAIGRNLVDLIIPPELQDRVKGAIKEMAKTGQAIPASELSLMRKDGSRVPVFSSHVIVQVPGRSPELFCVNLDLTELKRAETERRKLEEQVRQMQKLESIGRLAGGVAHDFNNKLQIILGFIGMILKRLPPDHPQRGDAKEIEKSAQHAAALTKQLLAFSRRQAIEPVELNPNVVIANNLKMLVCLIGEDICLNFAAQPGLGHVYMDPTQLDQIMANLVVNARDAIADTGEINITASNLALSADDCKDRADFVAPGNYVVLTCQDNGAGMTPDIQAQIFEPFFTTKPQGKGTGLGLATVYGIVKQNNGAITVHSVPGQGTTFTIYLPRLPEASRTAVESTAATSPSGHETILVVEDEAAVLDLTERTLSELGYKVLTATTPALALALCERHPEPIHLLLTDVVLPDMNGQKLSEQIQRRRPGIRIMFMSGYSAEIMERHDHLLPGVRLLQKPFTTELLARQVRTALDAVPACR